MRKSTKPAGKKPVQSPRTKAGAGGQAIDIDSLTMGARVSSGGVQGDFIASDDRHVMFRDDDGTLHQCAWNQIKVLSIVHKPTDREISFELLARPAEGAVDDYGQTMVRSIRILYRLDDAIYNAANAAEELDDVDCMNARLGLRIALEAVQKMLSSSLCNT